MKKMKKTKNSCEATYTTEAIEQPVKIIEVPLEKEFWKSKTFWVSVTMIVSGIMLSIITDIQAGLPITASGIVMAILRFLTKEAVVVSKKN